MKCREILKAYGVSFVSVEEFNNFTNCHSDNNNNWTNYKYDDNK